MSSLSAAEATKQGHFKAHIMLSRDPGLSHFWHVKFQREHLVFIHLHIYHRSSYHHLSSMYLVWTNTRLSCFQHSIQYVMEQDILCQYVSLLVR